MGAEPQEAKDPLASARQALAGERASACLLDADLRIEAVNAAWEVFATSNAGDRCLGASLRGTRYADHVDGPGLRAKVAADLARALRGEQVSIDSECNSQDRFRQLRTVYLPVRQGSHTEPVGLLVVHSVLREAAIGEAHDPHQAAEAGYRGAHGLMTMCSCCRRVRRVASSIEWHFVPAWVAHPPERLSHGFCATCVVQYGVGEVDPLRVP